MNYVKENIIKWTMLSICSVLLVLIHLVAVVIGKDRTQQLMYRLSKRLFNE